MQTQVCHPIWWPWSTTTTVVLCNIVAGMSILWIFEYVCKITVQFTLLQFYCSNAVVLTFRVVQTTVYCFYHGFKIGGTRRKNDENIYFLYLFLIGNPIRFFSLDVLTLINSHVCNQQHFRSWSILKMKGKDKLESLFWETL